MTFALIGNQNSGKTTLFNQLTGSRQHVGNFPGVTVEKKEGEIKKHKNTLVVDLPGIYSLSPYTAEEVVTRDFLLKGNINAIINIVDATNLERNLYLSLQLIELNMPMVIALNMMDEVRSNGNSIDIDGLEKELGVKIVPISAIKNEGVTELVESTIQIAKSRTLPKRLDFCSGHTHSAIHSVAHIIEANAGAIAVPIRFASTKVVEGDLPVIEALNLSENQKDIIKHIVENMEYNLDTDREAALSDMRYTFIEKLCALVYDRRFENQEKERSVNADKILTHKIFAIPIFLCIMLAIFALTFGVFGKTLSLLTELAISGITNFIDNALTNFGVSNWLHSLLIDGVFAGVGSVLSFLPTILVLFFFLSLLEDSGYMTRVAFVMDKVLRKIGLSGRSFVPMLIGFGCTVPAIMATRTLPNKRDRRMTIVLTPFMSCSAKLPIYAVFTAAFFPDNGALIMFLLYVLGIVMAIITGVILKNTIFQGEPVPFVMELPSYRFPSAKSVVLHMWEKAKDFIQKAFTVIFAASIIIWFLQSFNIHFNLVSDSTDSILALLGRAVAPIFAPLGFGDWKAATALITGLSAKEAVISTLTVLLGAENGITRALPQMFTQLQALSFLTFTLLYMPCIAAMNAVKRELGSWWGAIAAMTYQTGVAWIVAYLVYNVGRLFINA